ncbi:MAG: SDR family oxidoreductase [Pyrinomonadaceae bacterium]
MKLKPVSQQNILITGATSGIGLTTARMAAKKGANLGLIARNEQALNELCEELRSQGCRAVCAAADVGDNTEFRRAADTIVSELGHIDTWVNNAGVSVYGRIMEVPTEDMRQLFDTNLWGVVNGSKLAVQHLRQNGGALINLGSEVSDAAIPLQGIYTASKHAVKGLTDSLRMELEADGLPISVTLIQPTAIDTPYPQNAKNYLPYEPTLPAPMYAPELVAEAILHCAENKVPTFFVGDMSKINAALSHYAPQTMAKFQETVIDSLQNSGQPASPMRNDGLYDTNSRLNERGPDKDRFVVKHSPYHHAMLHPTLTKGLLLGGGLAIAALVASNMRQSNGGARAS